MEKFKETIRKRIWIGTIYNAICVMVIASGVIHNTVLADENVGDFISGSMLGVIIGIALVVIFYLAKYTTALKDNEKLKSIYIYENDERLKAINTKIGGVGINIIISGLAIGTIIGGFINATIYFTL